MYFLGEATFSEGLVKYFLRVPQAFGQYARAVVRVANSKIAFNQTFGTSCRTLTLIEWFNSKTGKVLRTTKRDQCQNAWFVAFGLIDLDVLRNAPVL